MSSTRFDINPLHDLLLESVDFDAIAQTLRYQAVPQRHQCAQGRVRQGLRNPAGQRGRGDGVSLPAVPVQGGRDRRRALLGWRLYVGNPVLFPFFYNCESRDVMIVHINPMERDEVPKTAPDILNRINEISFNSSLT
jgi:NTE family protein